MTPPGLPPARPVDIFLLLGALFVWFTSMFLPVFNTGSIGPPLPGGAILLLGILFGWLGNGLAAYANVFFLYAAWRLFAGKVPRISIVIMLVLAASLPLMNLFLGKSEARLLPIVAWGWGAFMWVWSMLLLTGATAARRGIIGAWGGLGLGLLMLLSGLAASALHAHQWRAANSEDRHELLPAGMIYTTSALCPVPLTLPAPSDAPDGEPLVLDIDAQLLHAPGRGPSLKLPGGFTEQHADGSAWILRSGGPIALMVRQKARPGALLLQVKASGDDAVIRLLGGIPQRVRYEQPVKRVAGWRSSSFCPVAERGLHGGMRSEYTAALQRAMGQGQTLAPMVPIAPLVHAELARQRCDVGADDIDHIAGLRTLDRREVMLPPQMNRMSGFCSENYIALAGGVERPDGRLGAIVHLLDRKTLTPLAMFDGTRTCPPALCAAGLAVTLNAIRLDGRSALVDTSHGQFAAALPERP